VTTALADKPFTNALETLYWFHTNGPKAMATPTAQISSTKVLMDMGLLGSHASSGRKMAALKMVKNFANGHHSNWISSAA